MVGVARKVAEDPAHIGLLPAISEIATEGTSRGSTVMVIPLLVAVTGLAQFALEVRMHVTICPLVKADVVKIELFRPALMPSTCH